MLLGMGKDAYVCKGAIRLDSDKDFMGRDFPGDIQASRVTLAKKGKIPKSALKKGKGGKGGKKKAKKSSML